MLIQLFLYSFIVHQLYLFYTKRNNLEYYILSYFWKCKTARSRIAKPFLEGGYVYILCYFWKKLEANNTSTSAPTYQHTKLIYQPTKIHS